MRTYMQQVLQKCISVVEFKIYTTITVFNVWNNVVSIEIIDDKNKECATNMFNHGNTPRITFSLESIQGNRWLLVPLSFDSIQGILKFGLC